MGSVGWNCIYVARWDDDGGHIDRSVECMWLIVVGYSVVTRIPRGATNLDIRQYAPNEHKDDDIYLGNVVDILADSHSYV